MTVLSVSNTVLVVVDVQEKLAKVMQDRESLLVNLAKLIRGLKALRVPAMWLEQNPARMGETVPEIRELLVGQVPVISKMSFSCCGEQMFSDGLAATGCRQVLLSGIEAHVCVCQTAVDLLAAGYEVSVVADAVSSRNARDRDIALARMKDEGATLCSVEMVLFELLRTAEHPSFKDVLNIVR